MQRTTLALLWGDRLMSEDGWSARVLGAFLSPRANRVTHVQAQRGFFGKPEAFSLENAHVNEDGALLLAKGASGDPGRGSVHLSNKTAVTIAGVHGTLRGLILDLRSKAPRYVLARYLGDVRALRNDQVQNLSSGSPSAKLSTEEAATLPVHRPDAQALSNAQSALERATRVEDTFAFVDLQVSEGIAYLSGNVQFPVQREEGERAVRSAKGVLEVQSTIVTDWDLCLKLAEALAKAGANPQGRATVKSVHGNVTLRGYLPSQELVNQAVAAAQKTSGVRSVTSEVLVEQKTAEAHSEAPKEATVLGVAAQT